MAKGFEREGTRTPPLPEFPTDAIPGTAEKLKVMEYRVQQGYQPHHPDDRKVTADREAVAAGDDDGDGIDPLTAGLLIALGADDGQVVANRGARTVEAGTDTRGHRMRTRGLLPRKAARAPGQYPHLRKAAVAEE